MDDSAKYLIHADVVADGVVERSDVVGAVFGQTEGLIGEELDIRDLQDSAKLGRIDVEIETEGGQSFGHITVGSNLDRVETAILAAALETIDRVGPCRSTISVRRIEDVRAAKRRTIVDRAQELLAEGFDEGAISGAELVEEVREALRVHDVSTFEGLPAGPNVPEGDAIIVVEGRADVNTLLQYGIKNAVAVEGTDIPESVVELTRARTTTAFLDGDRGGDLILRELSQRGDIDYVARAPEGTSVEDLSREAVLTALREKAPIEVALEGSHDQATVEPATDGSVVPEPVPARESGTRTEDTADDEGPTPTSESSESDNADMPGRSEGSSHEPNASEVDQESGPLTHREHAEAVFDGEARARVVDAEGNVVDEGPIESVVELVESAVDQPRLLVFDGPISQRVLDVAAQHGVDDVIGRERGDVTKPPAAVRVRTADELGLS